MNKVALPNFENQNYGDLMEDPIKNESMFSIKNYYACRSMLRVNNFKIFDNFALLDDNIINGLKILKK